MEMFVLSYANVLCIYPKLFLQVGSAIRLRTYLTNQYVILRYYISFITYYVSLIYVNATIFSVICPSKRFKLIISWPRMNLSVPRLSQNASYG